MSDAESLGSSLDGPPATGWSPRSTWRWYATLAAPFVLTMVIVYATGKAVQNGASTSDEPLHWSLTLWLAERLPGFDPVYPYSATTPLFHWLGALFVRAVGLSLKASWSLNALFSVGAVWALFSLLRRELRHTARNAALLTAVFFTSTYFFGYSFRWLTDNLALLFCILCVGALLRSANPSEPRQQRAFLVGCLWFSLAVLTRQSFLFLALPMVTTLLTARLPVRSVVIGFIGMALAIVPFAWLVLSWHGLVPPAYQSRHTGSHINLYPLGLPLMLLGFYTPFFEGPGLWQRLRSSSPPSLLWPGIAVAVGLIVVALYPLAPIEGHPEWSPYFPELSYERKYGFFGGWVYNVGRRLPMLRHNSIVYWVLFPLGVGAFVYYLLEGAKQGTDRLRRVAVVFLAGLIVSSVLNRLSIQKYYDPPVLLFLIWYARGEIASDRLRRTLLVALIALFCAYFAVYPWTVKPGDEPVADPTVPTSTS